ncbi:MAG: DUF5723 family protein [Cytophagaceae bacterium]
MYRSKIFLSTLLCLCLNLVFAQQETTIGQLSFTGQSGYADISKLASYRTTVSLPFIGGFQTSYLNSGFAYNDLVSQDNVVDPGKVIPDLKRLNTVNTSGTIEWANVRIRHGDKQIQVTFRDVYSMRVIYPKTLAELGWYGNAHFAGQTADLSGLRIQQNYYRELGIAYTFKMNDKWTIGVKPKLLMGVTNVTTRHSKNSIYTDPDGLEIKGNADIDIYTSGFVNSDNEFDFGPKDFFTLKNLGWGLDLGATYKLNDKINISGNLMNLGMIRWTNKVNRYDINGDYNYTGYILHDSADIANADWKNVLDTLEAIFKPEITHKSYNSYLSPQLYLKGEYLYNDKLTLYGAYISDIYFRYRAIVTVGGVYTINHMFQATLNYSFMTDKYFNIGAGVAYNAGPVQIYGALDNIPGFFDPFNQRYFNARAGINFVFGKLDSDGEPLAKNK